MSSPSNKFPNIITETIIVQGYESVKKGNISFANLMPNAAAIITNQVIFHDYLMERVPNWFSLTQSSDKKYVEFISSTVGLAGGFMIADKLLGETDGLKQSVIKGAMISMVELIITSLDPKKVIE